MTGEKLSEIILVEIGQKAPDVELVDTEKNPVRISSFKGKPTVILFYPGAFTGTCTKEMCTMRDNLPQYNNLDVNVVGISVDGPFANKAFKNANNINFPLLSDFNREAVRAFGNYHENFSGIKGYTASKRAVYILDGDSVVRFKWVSENPGVEPDYVTVASEAQKVKSM
jgi:glutaredoxin-dependent peroxiredoxin